MNTSRVAMLVVISIVQFLAMISMAQSSQPLRSRIPKADPKKYQTIRDGQNWQNPKIFVRPGGIEIIGVTPAARGIPVESVPDVLEHLPDSAWPYGLVVAVSDVGVIGSEKDIPRIQTNRVKLLKILRQHGIVVELWPSA
jgi:hypothetical protein